VIERISQIQYYKSLLTN